MTADVIALSAAFSVIALVAVYALLSGSPPTATGPRVRARLLAELASLPPPAAIVELGSGWGSLTLPLADLFPEADVEGFEISPLPWLVSRLRQGFGRRANLRHHRRDFFDADLRDAELVICYLQPAAMEKLKVKLETELDPEAWVVSHTFRMPDWRPVRVSEADDIYRSPIYLYRMGDRVPAD